MVKIKTMNIDIQDLEILAIADDPSRSSLLSRLKLLGLTIFAVAGISGCSGDYVKQTVNIESEKGSQEAARKITLADKGQETITQSNAVESKAAVIFRESFDHPTSELVSNRWILGENTQTVDVDGAKCLEVINRDRDRSLSSIYVKVEPGKRYSVRCLIKTEGVVHPGRRGATIFAEWADKDRKFISGGLYPLGKGGTSPWDELNIRFTNIVPEYAGFLRVYVGIDGKGKAWFRDLVVEVCNNGLKLALEAPADKAVLRNARPLFSWKDIDKEYQLVIAGNRSLSKDRQLFSIGSQNSFLLPGFLDSGTTWYWQVQETTLVKEDSDQNFYCSEVQSFNIAKSARKWPALVESHYKWSDAPKPMLMTRVFAPDKVDIEVDIDGERAEILSYKDGILTFTPQQSLAAAIHSISYTFRDSQGESSTASDSYSNVKPGSHVSYKQGITYVDNEAFFPIGAYCDPSDDPANFAGLVEAGFNLAHSYVFEREDAYDGMMDTARMHLDAAQRNDIKIFLGMPRGWIRKQNNPEIEKYVSSLMAYPALLSWYIMDEPAPQNIGVHAIRNAAEAIRRIDPFHPSLVAFCVMVDAQSQSAKEYIKPLDIIGCDPYPLMRNKPFSTVERWVENCRAMGGSNKPVWSIIEAFDADYDSGGIKRGNVKQFGPVIKPTYDQMKCQAFLSLAAGADGIIFYWMSRHRYDMKQDAPVVWASICQLVKELQAVTSFMTTPRSVTTLSVTVPEPFRVWIRSNSEGETAIAFINPLETQQHLKVKLDLGAKALFADGEMLPTHDGLYESTFRPYETEVYIVK